MIQTNDDRDPVEELAEEFLERRRQGESVSTDDYVRQYPQWSQRIRSLFPMLIMVEDAKEPLSASPGENQYLDSILCDDIQRLGDFRVIRRIGQGGMGVVYEAEQESLGRRVALKLMSAGCLTTPKQLERFERESRAAAKLHHTNIVPVFGVGQQRGMHYYIMQLIDGQSLDVVLNQSDAPLRNDWKRIATIGEQTASALEHAHHHGVLHRDIKPANLLLGKNGDVWITDFGLAKLFDQNDVTRPGDAVGTLRYMPPEQFKGATDHRSDVYSLGMTLYELLVFRPAYEETDRSRLIQRLAQDDPIRPRIINPLVPADLETIVLKAISRLPEDRYQNAAELAEDLNLFLNDRPIHARRISAIGRLKRWSFRNPAIASLTLTAFALSILVAVISSIGFVRINSALERESQLRQLAEDERTKARTEGHRAETERDRAEDNLRFALVAFDQIFHQLTSGKATTNPVASEYSERFFSVVSRENAKVLQQLLAFYEQFAELNDNNPELQSDLARAHRRVGSINRQLGQFDDSEAAYRRALAVYEQMSASTGCTLETASLHTNLGLLRYSTGRYVEADKSYAVAEQQLESLLEVSPQDRSVRFALAKLHTYRGDLKKMYGKLENAIRSYWTAVRLLRDLVDEFPQNPAYRHMLAVAHRETPSREMDRDQQKEDDAIRILVQLTKEYPDMPVYRYDLSESYAMIERDYLVQMRRDWNRDRVDKSQLEHSVSRLQLAISLGEELVESYPSVPQYQVSLASSLRKLGSVLQDLEGADSAETTFRRSLEHQESLAKQFVQAPAHGLNLAQALYSLGENLRRQGRFLEARHLFERALENQKTFLEKAPENEWAKLRLAAQHHSLGITFRELGNFSESRQHRQTAQEIRDNMERLAPSGRRRPRRF